MNERRVAPPNAVSATSSRLLSDARRNEPLAWNQLVHIYGPVVKYWIGRSGVTSTADGDDIAQEVFVAVLRNLSVFRREPGQAKFRAWLKSITRSKVVDYLRRTRRVPVATTDAADLQLADETAESASVSSGVAEGVDDPDETAADDRLITQRVLEMVRGEFSDTGWLAFWRTAVDANSATDVARELGMTSAAVRKAKSRVLGRVREVLAELGVE